MNEYSNNKQQRTLVYYTTFSWNNQHCFIDFPRVGEWTNKHILLIKF